MRIELSSEPGSPDRPNEDFASIALPAGGQGGVLVLLDGVTPPKDGDGCVHSVPWYVTRLGTALLDLAATDRDLPLPRCLSAAVARVARAHGGECDLTHPRTPQSTVVAARWGADDVEFLVLSDSVLLVDRGGRRFDVVRDDRLGHLPQPVPALRRRVRSLPRGSAERATAAAEYGAAVEALRNAPGGFFTAAADPSVAWRATSGVLPRRSVRALAALSDGATRLVEVFGELDWAGVLALLRKEGAHELLLRVRASESADPDGATHPRGKAHDDATAVLVEL